MNFKLTLPFLSCLIAFWLWQSNDTFKSDYYQDEFRPVLLIQAKAFQQEIESLHNTALSYKQKKASIKELRSQLAKTRMAFKKAECILEYYYPKHIKSYINGAPLNHLDPYPVKEEFNTNNYYGLTPQEYSKTVPVDQLNTDHYRGQQRVVAPVGLQVLDETVFGESQPDAGIVIELTEDLIEKFPTVLRALEFRNYYYEHEVMEAARLELVRIFSLGITGFDTPGSLNAMEEAATALQGTQDIIQPLTERLKPEQHKATDVVFSKAISYLKKNKDFDSFERAVFLTEYFNPLYQALLEMQQQLGIKSVEQMTGQVTSWNAYSKGLFAEDFLNPYYYTMLKEKDDSPELRNLGKMLFYDPLLSGSSTMSCASCHKPELAFSDGVAKSVAGVAGKTVLRNSPSLINAVFADKYFYDLRAFDLEEQAGHVIENHLEFNTTYDEIIRKLNNTPKYKAAFEKAFGADAEINRYRFSAALTSYVMSLRSFDSAFDRFARGDAEAVSEQVKQGFNLFMGKAACATCHFAPTFSGLVPPLFQENESEVLGVMVNPSTMQQDSDVGRIGNKIIEDQEEIYRNSFKTTSVRNVALTAPYFHNGAYKTLNEVIDFYNTGGAAGVGMSYEVPNQTLPPDHLNLSKKEVAALIAFLESLTDNNKTF